MYGRESRYAIIASVLAVTASLLTFIYLNSVRASESQLFQAKLATFKNRESVVVAKQNISAGSEITANEITIEKVAAAYVADSASKEINKVIGQTALVDIYKGEQIIGGRFGMPESVPAASRTISDGKLAIAVAVDEVSGVGGGIRPGDRVDVFVTFEDSNASELLFGNLLVRGVGGTYPYGGVAPSKTKKESEGSGFGSSEVAAGASNSDSVILEVTEDQARLITYASEKGKIRLGLLPARGE